MTVSDYNDIIKSLKSLQNDCSTGYDNIPVYFIKPTAEYIASPLIFWFIISNLIEESKFPDQWKVDCISPIPKVTNPTEMKGYRPISALPILSLKHNNYTTNANLVIAKTTQMRLSSQNNVTTPKWLWNKVNLQGLFLSIIKKLFIL